MKLLSSVLITLALVSIVPSITAAQEVTLPQVEPIAVEDNYLTGIIRTIKTGEFSGQGQLRTASVEIISGSKKGETIDVAYGGNLADGDNQLSEGEKVIVVRNQAGNEVSYFLADRYRLPGVLMLILGLFALAILIGRKQGIMATLGLIVSIGIFGFIILPQIQAGSNPILVMLLGAIAIATTTTYLAHGFRQSSTIILTSILATLGISTLLTIITTKILGLSGNGTEEALALNFGPLEGISLEHLLIAGIIIGALGILDDVCATQVSVVRELKETDNNLSRSKLFTKSMNVGKEHVAALVNTLFLAYAATAIPLLLVGRANLSLPIWALINSEAVSEEILRIVIGSGSLILAVPIATALAAWWLSREKISPEKD